MKILHICSDFTGSKVHTNLYRHLDQLGVTQVVYTYIRDEKKKGKNSFVGNNTQFVYSSILKLYHRIIYHKKIIDVYEDLKTQVNLNTIDLVHCSTLCSDGGIALKIYKEYGIPFVTAVRSTDVNNFMKYAIHTWFTTKHIIDHTSQLFFITPSIEHKFYKHLITHFNRQHLKALSKIIPNGIDDFWLDNMSLNVNKNNHRIIYVGSFLKRKKAVDLANAVLKLKKKYKNIQLIFVGNGGNDQIRVEKFARLYPDTISYLGHVSNKNELKKLYNSCSVFALPSIGETFGLVYFEALSQGCPILYTRNDGIDGLVPDMIVGKAINPTNVDNIANGIDWLFTHYPEKTFYKTIYFEQFRWKNIAERYKQIYEEVLRNGNH